MNNNIDRDILYDMYVQKHMKMFDIAKHLNVSTKCLRRNLIKHDISIRKRGFGFNVLPEIRMTKEQLEFFDGLMASDGSICRRKSVKSRKTKGNDFLSCGFSHKEFAEYIVNKLDLGVSVKPYIHYSNRYIKGKCLQYKFLSKSNIFFTKQRDRWYPNGVKIIPKDFRFSPTSINILYLSDGFRRSKDGRVYLCTNSFDSDDLCFLVDKLKSAGIKSKITSKNEINILNVDSFFNYTGSCPVSCYNYKWKSR